jgi:hypothetical protein
MKKAKGNWGLLNQGSLVESKQEKAKRLQGLSMKEGIRLVEQILSSPLVEELRRNSPEDRPMCIKKCLEIERRNTLRRRRYAALKKETCRK